MDDNWREETAYSCAAVVIIGTLLAALLVCVTLAGLLGGGAYVAHGFITAPTMTPHGGYTGLALQQLPEYALIYPGASAIYAGSGERPAGLLKGTYATAWQSFGTDDSATQVLSWYDQALQLRGWVLVTTPSVGTATSVAHERLWSKGGLTYRLTIHAPTAATQTAPTYATGYAVELSAR